MSSKTSLSFTNDTDTHLWAGSVRKLKNKRVVSIISLPLLVGAFMGHAIQKQATAAADVECCSFNWLSMRNTYADIRAQSEFQIPPIVIKHAKRSIERYIRRARAQQREREERVKVRGGREWGCGLVVGVTTTSRRASQLTAPINRPIYRLVCATSNWNYAQLIDRPTARQIGEGDHSLMQWLERSGHGPGNGNGIATGTGIGAFELGISAADNCRQLIALTNSEQNSIPLITDRCSQLALASSSSQRDANTSSSYSHHPCNSYKNNLHK